MRPNLMAFALAASVATGAGGQAEAALVVTGVQSGTDVVFTGEGTLDLSGLDGGATIATGAFIVPRRGVFQLSGGGDLYGGIVGPAAFGTGNIAFASSQTGSYLYLDAPNSGLGVPLDYKSGSPISNTLTFADATFQSLGLTVGTYVYTLGSAADADTLTFQILAPAPAVPEMATWAMMTVGLGVTGAFLRWRRKVHPHSPACS